MSTKFKIKPSSATPVLDPLTFEPLKKTGEDKPRNEYWLRRLADGSVVEVSAKTKEK